MGDHIYNKVSEDLVEKLKKIVPGKVYTKDEINKDFFHDEMPIYGEGEPEVVIDVTTTEAISEIMKLCYENNSESSRTKSSIFSRSIFPVG